MFGVVEVLGLSFCDFGLGWCAVHGRLDLWCCCLVSGLSVVTAIALWLIMNGCSRFMI